MFNPHQHQQQQQQFHQHLRQLQQLFQQQTPPPPPPPPQPPPARHITHTRPMASASARMVNLCSATQAIIAPNPMLQGALLMQQMQGKLMLPNIARTVCDQKQS
ncbi:tripartite motif-containing protein 66-like [Sinocyclocheilus rhinocerous]|uniref:tripartite motif-containing protein 66-like n=1 Tax=Sinocyclocheilus rhinocerous TaxID=307959 RepID=UPI0007B9B42E|nr:PREDICTED: tripartite motif-containing protein 66-like [Sinocyclocheilus rhinocerous]XP_016411680.1 PREDICTED: tripartite motif-containing protein 66-like [Sinocyclocheilus rhinocerous]